MPCDFGPTQRIKALRPSSATNISSTGIRRLVRIVDAQLIDEHGPASGMDDQPALLHADDDAARLVGRAQIGFVHFRLRELERKRQIVFDRRRDARVVPQVRVWAEAKQQLLLAVRRDVTSALNRAERFVPQSEVLIDGPADGDARDTRAPATSS